MRLPWFFSTSTQKNKKNIIFAPKSFRGVCVQQTEIKPIEPDPDHTGVGIRIAYAASHPSLFGFMFQDFGFADLKP